VSATLAVEYDRADGVKVKVDFQVYNPISVWYCRLTENLSSVEGKSFFRTRH